VSFNLDFQFMHGIINMSYVYTLDPEAPLLNCFPQFLIIDEHELWTRREIHNHKISLWSFWTRNPRLALGWSDKAPLPFLARAMFYQVEPQAHMIIIGVIW